MWIKNNKIFKNSVALNGHIIYNPTVEEIKAAGYTWVEPETPSHRWMNKELFISAVCKLMPAEAIVTALSDATILKDAVAGLSLLSTNAAPGNLIDVNDERVAQWLSVGGVTVEQVIKEINNIEVNNAS